MMVEYVLLLTILSTLVFTMFTSSNGAFNKSFNNSAPRLGARIERLIRTGEEFNLSGSNAAWAPKR